MGILKGICKFFRCCLKTAAVIDEAIDERDHSNHQSDIVNNVTISVPTNVQPASQPISTPKILVSRPEPREQGGGNSPVHIQIAGSIHFAPNSELIINTDSNFNAEKSDEESDASELHCLSIDRNKMILALARANTNKFQVDYQEVMASPKTKHVEKIRGQEVKMFYITPPKYIGSPEISSELLGSQIESYSEELQDC